jgi:2-polyprenyl-6-methoxyphenol hydroxylase-like FAD-dependent oxidoreductase
MYISARDTNLAKVNFAGLTRVTKYPYAALISQSETEEVLQKRLEELGVTILRPYSVSDIKESPSGIEVTFNDGSVTTTRYLVGADGSRSTVRRLARIPFRDPKTGAELTAYSGNTTVEPVKQGKKAKTTGFPLIIADAYMTIPSDAHHVSLKDMSVFLGNLGFLLLAPLPPAPDDPEKRPIYRLSCAPEPGVPEKTINQSWLQSMVDSTIGFTKTGGCKVESVIWSSSFVAQSATADTFTKSFGKGTIVLIGDAAHIHSPAGGQGMNLGLRDAAQLGRILSQLLKESKPAAPGVVDSRLAAFGKRRRGLATEVIKMTKVITWATGLKAPASRKTRNAVWWLIGRTKKANTGIALKLSGVKLDALVS